MKLKRTKNASWKVIDNEGVVLHLKTGNYYSLNELGLKVWQLCDGKHTLEKIKAQVSEEYAAKSDKVRRDVEKFLSKLHKERLVEIA